MIDLSRTYVQREPSEGVRVLIFREISKVEVPFQPLVQGPKLPKWQSGHVAANKMIAFSKYTHDVPKAVTSVKSNLRIRAEVSLPLPSAAASDSEVR
jgi:hypothetical protein